MRPLRSDNLARSSTTPPKLRSKLQLVACVVAWGLAVMVCTSSLWIYGSTPGEAGDSPEDWPAQSHVTRGQRLTLLFFAHPLCPCTRSSLAELQRLAVVFDGRVDSHIIFIAPDGIDDGWSKSDLCATAASIPGSTVHSDVDRRESRLFGARTSGLCLLYDETGQLVFRGGLTASRGHEGHNEGTDSVRALVLRRGENISKTCVYGCPLFEPEKSTVSSTATAN